MMKRIVQVNWYSNTHDHSLHWIKFGLMQLHDAGKIRLVDIPCERAIDLPKEWTGHSWRRLVALRILTDDVSSLVLLDGEDSIFQTSPLIKQCDFYFVCSFNKDFFSGRPFTFPFTWQSEDEVAHYRMLYEKLQSQYSGHLHKAHPLGPIGPSLDTPQVHAWHVQKFINLCHKLRRLVRKDVSWRAQQKRFQKRMSRLAVLRQLSPIHDVVLRDSLWGWPRHRIQLHKHLATLPEEYDVRTRLDWRQPEAYELGAKPCPLQENFPMVRGDMPSDYEAALAASRLGIFATGFHYGCRNIVTLAWYLGIRTLLDPLRFDCGTDLSGLDISYHQSGDWSSVDAEINRARQDASSDRLRRQNFFDEKLSSAVLAERMISVVTGKALS